MAEDKNIMPVDDGEDRITLTLEDGSELVCSILAIFPCNKKEYIALLPQNKEGEDIYLYRFIDHGNDDIELIDITDDDEFDAASDAFDELLDSEEFDEMIGSDEDGDM